MFPKEGNMLWHPRRTLILVPHLFVFLLSNAAQADGAEILWRKTGTLCWRDWQEQWVSKNAGEPTPLFTQLLLGLEPCYEYQCGLISYESGLFSLHSSSNWVTFFLQEFWKDLGEMGLLGITAPGKTEGIEKSDHQFVCVSRMMR